MKNHTEIIVKYLPDSDKWELQKEVTVELFDGNILTIPTGFITDFATVPWWARWAIAKTSKANLGYIVHDYLYKSGYYYLDLRNTEKVARRKSDGAQYHINKMLDVKKIETYLIWFAGRIAGKFYWDKYRLNERIIQNT